MYGIRPLPLAGSAAAVVALALTMGATPAAAVDAAAAPSDFLSVVTATGTNKTPYARTSATATWQSLGGQLVGPPAVVRAVNERTYYVGKATNGNLYVRTNTTGWSRLHSTTNCGNPAISADSTHLNVTCRGISNGALYLGKAPLSASAPVVASWTSLGGKISSDPAMITASWGNVYLAIGPRYSYEDWDGTVRSGNVWGFDHADGWYQWDLDCAGRPSIAANRSGIEQWWVSCVRTGGSVAFQHYVFGDAPDYREGVISATATGVPGIAVSPDGGTARIYVQGTNSAVYVSTLTSDTKTAFAKLGGAVMGGVGATSLN
ncbi:MAG: hypothetical protein M3P91_12530 [Actinomycetota bacterium]|nr:hypothetical protein [Actinomycetota bacterium]